MMELMARDILAMSIPQVIGLGDGPFTVVYDDGERHISKARALLYTRLYWELFKGYEKTPLLYRHHVDYVLKGKSITSKTNIALSQNIYTDIVLTYELITPQSKDHIWRRINEVNTAAYNFLILHTQGNESSIDLMDFIEIVTHPKMVEIKKNMSGDPVSITHAYEKGLNLIQNEPSFKDNGVSLAVRAGMVRINQALQCFVARGIPLEITGDFFSTAVLSNFTLGLYSLYSFATESRSAAKAQFLSDTHIQDTEYFARRLQLLTMTVTGISYNDCGSTDYMKWRVFPPEYNEGGIETYPGDLKFMVGKHYTIDGSDELKTIQGDEVELFDKVINIRTILHCKEPNPHMVCYKCLGGMHHNLPKQYILGHISAAVMTRQSTQLTLSSKHHIGSGETNEVVVRGLATAYVMTNPEKSGLMLHPKTTNKNPKIVLSMTDGMGLNDIIYADDIDEVNPRRITRIEHIELRLTENGKEVGIHVPVAMADRKGFLTPELLKFIKEQGWEVDERGNFIIDLSKWSNKVAFIMLPDMEYSYSTHSNQVAQMIESNIKDITDRNNKGGPEKVLQDLFLLVNTKLSVNMAALEVIIYANSVNEEGSYGMSRGVKHPKMGVADQVIRNRSLGAAYTYEKIRYTITNPRSFFRLDRPDSPMDVFIKPREVLEALNE